MLGRGNATVGDVKVTLRKPLKIMMVPVKVKEMKRLTWLMFVVPPKF